MVALAVPALVAKKGADVTGEFLKEKMGYDFVNLVTKLAVFYVISFLISKYMEAVIYFQGGLTIIAGFFGIKLAQADKLPKRWVELFVSVTTTCGIVLIICCSFGLGSFGVVVTMIMGVFNTRKPSHIYFHKRK